MIFSQLGMPVVTIGTVVFGTLSHLQEQQCDDECKATSNCATVGFLRLVHGRFTTFSNAWDDLNLYHAHACCDALQP